MKKKELETLRQEVKIYNEYIGMEFGIEKCAMLIMKLEMTWDGRNRTSKSRQNQNARRNGNLQIHGNIGSGHPETLGGERKNEKRVPQ